MTFDFGRKAHSVIASKTISLWVYFTLIGALSWFILKLHLSYKLNPVWSVWKLDFFWFQLEFSPSTCWKEICHWDALMWWRTVSWDWYIFVTPIEANSLLNNSRPVSPSSLELSCLIPLICLHWLNPQLLMKMGRPVVLNYPDSHWCIYTDWTHIVYWEPRIAFNQCK